MFLIWQFFGVEFPYLDKSRLEDWRTRIVQICTCVLAESIIAYWSRTAYSWLLTSFRSHSKHRPMWMKKSVFQNEFSLESSFKEYLSAWPDRSEWRKKQTNKQTKQEEPPWIDCPFCEGLFTVALFGGVDEEWICGGCRSKYKYEEREKQQRQQQRQ